ncbi:hypothetical protein [Pyrococcus kukulkanii]|uniref:Phosphatidate cytidylyltransferase n=1 Tax=Pyrococcus kukulkanii TaxID=1609559 RepID=A0ABV4T1Z1_9EURY
MLSEKLLVLLFFVFSIIYGRFIYVGKTIKGIRVSLTFLLTLYIAGKVLLESDTGFWGLLVPVLVFYLTAISYYSYLEVTGRLDSFLEGRKKRKWGLSDALALVVLILLFEVIPLVAVYLATRSLFLSIVVGFGSGLFLFTLPEIDRGLFRQVFNIYTIITVIIAVTLALGVYV